MPSCVLIFVLSEETTSEQRDYHRLHATVLTSDRNCPTSDFYSIRPLYPTRPLYPGQTGRHVIHESHSDFLAKHSTLPPALSPQLMVKDIISLLLGPQCTLCSILDKTAMLH